jgi:hypothetical protein
VNGRPETILSQRGFTALHRTWRTGDVVELDVEMSLRLEELLANGGPRHEQTVAVMYGPLVLFVLREPGETGPLSFTRDALLGAERTGPREWRLRGAGDGRSMVPFIAVGERKYSTYVNVS